MPMRSVMKERRWSAELEKDGDVRQPRCKVRLNGFGQGQLTLRNTCRRREKGNNCKGAGGTIRFTQELRREASYDPEIWMQEQKERKI